MLSYNFIGNTSDDNEAKGTIKIPELDSGSEGDFDVT